MNVSDVKIGGKGSTQYVVKGSQKEFPQELLEELKIICEVPNPSLFEYIINLNHNTVFHKLSYLVIISPNFYNIPSLQDNISLDYDERYMHGKPQHSFHQAVNIPDVIVYPR
jgi:hypothetical protein